MKSGNVKPVPHTAGIVAALVSVAGVLLEVIPLVQGQVPPRYAWIVLVVGIVCQALTKGALHGDTVLITRDEARAVGFANPEK